MPPRWRGVKNVGGIGFASCRSGRERHASSPDPRDRTSLAPPSVGVKAATPGREYGRAVTFYPDGETPIPNQTPIPDRPPAPGEPASTTSQPASSRFTKAITRTTVINGVVLVAAVLLAYVFPVSDDPNIALVIVVVAAVLCAIHLTVVLMREMRRRQHALGTIPSTVPPTVTSAPPGSAAPGAPYGSVPATGAQGQLAVEDVFSITGRGTVATGTVTAGELWVGQPVQIVREGQVVAAAEIAGLEQFRSTTEVAAVGDHVGVLLTRVSRSDVQRGDVISA